MTTTDQPSNIPDGLTLLLGLRQAQIMRLFWALGEATAREIHTQLVKDTSLAYTTITTFCTRLTERGLLRKQRIARLDGSLQSTYRYTPALSEADFVRAEVGLQIDSLLTHYASIIYDHLARADQLHRLSDTDNPALSAPSRDRWADALAVEVARAQQLAQTSTHCAATAERRANALATEVERAQQLAQAAIHRAEIAEGRAAALAVEAASVRRKEQAATHRAVVAEQEAEQARAEAQRAHQRTLLVEAETVAALRRSQLRRYSKANPIVEHYDPSGICRVCGQKAAPVIKSRRDGLRLCSSSDCKHEAQRRDNLVKQRQFQDRRRLQRAQPDSVA
jgi:predicted transcriptional regulator